MAIRLTRFHMPKRLTKETQPSSTYGKYTVAPFEEGCGRAIGNALRRVLLSSIEGSAITSVTIHGALHEFCTLAGVVEDVPQIVTNLKGVLVNVYTREPRTLHLDVATPGSVTARDIVSDAPVEIVNPDHHIATLDQVGRLRLGMTVRIGRGYRSAESNRQANQEIGVIPIDSLYSPIVRVRYGVEHLTALPHSEQLVMEIWTDGRISADDALIQAAAILRHHLTIFVHYDPGLILFDEQEQEADRKSEELNRLLSMSVNEMELSVRSTNCLNNANILTVGELAAKTESELLKYRNFGRKSLTEIKAKLAELGVQLGRGR